MIYTFKCKRFPYQAEWVPISKVRGVAENYILLYKNPAHFFMT